MTLINATSLNDQVDYSGTNGRSFAEQTLNSIFNVSPRNAVTDDDDEDDLDQTLPDPDEDDLIADDDDAFPDDLETSNKDETDDDDLDDDDEDLDADTYTANADELDKIDDNDDNAGVIERETNNDDDRGSVSTPFTKPSSFADRSEGRTTGRMIDHEPGSPNNL